MIGHITLLPSDRSKRRTGAHEQHIYAAIRTVPSSSTTQFGWVVPVGDTEAARLPPFSENFIFLGREYPSPGPGSRR